MKKWIERTDNLKYLLSKLDENTTQNDKEFVKKYRKILNENDIKINEIKNVKKKI